MRTLTKKQPVSSAELNEFLLDVLPEPGEWSDEWYLWISNTTNRLVELSDGWLEFPPMPTPRHQNILRRLFLAFDAYLNPLGGDVVFAPLRLQLRPGKFREPDLLLVQKKGDERVQERFWTGADLVLEVLSPDDPNRDLVKKRREYARAGIPEYWIVDPRKETITVLTLSGQRYLKAGAYKRGQRAASVLLQDFSVPVADVFDTK